MRIKILTLLIMLLFIEQQLASAQKTEQRNLSAFTQISLKNDAKVILTQGATPSVTVKAKETIIEQLVTEVKDRKLIIRYPFETKFKSNWNPGEVEVYVTIPQIDDLSISGSGSIIADEKIDTYILEAAISGSGSIKIKELKAEKFTASLSGSGNVIVAGGQPVAEFKGIISGSGSIKAIDFQTKNADIKIVGSGNCHITVNENLTAWIAGSGSVFYHGNPSINTTILGSGAVKEDK